MTEEQERKLVEELTKPMQLKGVRRIVTKEQYDLCVKYDANLEHIYLSNHHFMYKGKNGKYTPRKGYYKILDVRNYINSPEEKTPDIYLLAYYSRDFTTDFIEEDIVITSRPFFNRVSVGPKIDIQVGMIIHVKEEVEVVQNSYRVVWDILE